MLTPASAMGKYTESFILVNLNRNSSWLAVRLYLPTPRGIVIPTTQSARIYSQLAYTLYQGIYLVKVLTETKQDRIFKSHNGNMYYIFHTHPYPLGWSIHIWELYPKFTSRFTSAAEMFREWLENFHAFYERHYNQMSTSDISSFGLPLIITKCEVFSKYPVI